MLQLLSILILLSSFILMANKRAKSYIKTFRLQSTLIAIVVGIEGFESFIHDKRIDILIIFVLIIVLKIIYLPNLLYKTNSKVTYKVQKDFFLNIPLLVIICCILVLFSYYSISNIPGIDNSNSFNLEVGNSISLVLIGLFFMISRKKALGQIIGFLVMENGLFMTSVSATHGMPLIVDIGIFIDLITAALIMGFMVFKINEKYESTDINNLKDLRG